MYAHLNLKGINPAYSGHFTMKSWEKSLNFILVSVRSHYNYYNLVFKNKMNDAFPWKTHKLYVYHITKLVVNLEFDLVSTRPGACKMEFYLFECSYDDGYDINMTLYYLATLHYNVTTVY